jgi:hypothetical protein
MVTVRVKGGTPEDATSLCVSCTHGLVRKGFSAAEEEVFCNLTTPTTRVHFKVREWVLLTKTAGRSIGFVTAQKFREIEGDDAEIPPATVRDTSRDE